MWVRLDDKMPHHPKIARAGTRAAWVFVAGLCYANEHATGGFVPSAIIRRLSDERNPLALVQRLVDEGLWDLADGGYTIHDYFDFQPKSDGQVDTNLSEKRARAGREGGLRSGKARAREASPKQPDALASAEARSPGPDPDPPPVPDADDHPLSVPFASIPIAPPRPLAEWERFVEMWRARTGLNPRFDRELPEARQRIEEYMADAGDERDPWTVAALAIDTFARYVEGCSVGYKPKMSAGKFLEHWPRVETVLNGGELEQRPRRASDGPRIVAGLDYSKKETP